MMNANLKAFMLTAILITSISMAPAFGQVSDPIMVTVDKASYMEGETIMVTGEVMNFLTGTPVSIVITAPNGNVVAIGQVDVNADRTFSKEFIAGGQLMKSEGTYTINVQQGSPSRMSETTFEFGGTTEMTEPDPMPGTQPNTYPVVIEGSEYSVPYSIMGGTLSSIMPNMDDKSLLITISSMEDGQITITLPRSVIDAMDGNMDTDFIVMVDNEESNDVEETKTASDRMLTIPFSAGTETIEIIGTWIVPEFGTIAVMILVVAIVSIIAISARSRLSIMPRY